jgi:LDH2 family malate/lactate/ureidoglycolate dehydrogenase
MGEHKGSALMLVTELLSAALIGAGSVATANPDGGRWAVNNLMMIVIDPKR